MSNGEKDGPAYGLTTEDAWSKLSSAEQVAYAETFARPQPRVSVPDVTYLFGAEGGPAFEDFAPASFNMAAEIASVLSDHVPGRFDHVGGIEVAGETSSFAVVDRGEHHRISVTTAPEPQDPGFKREPPDLDQSDYEADGARMRDEQQYRAWQVQFAELLLGGRGLPCTFAGCSGFFFEELAAMEDDGSPGEPSGWAFVPIPEDAEEAVGVHDHRTIYQTGNYMTGWDGQPYVREPDGFFDRNV